MPAVIYPYTVTNSYKGGLFMRTYSRNVRRAWDGEEYRPVKRLRLDDRPGASSSGHISLTNENSIDFIDFEDNLERAIRETSVAALSSSPSRKNSTVFSLESQEDENASIITPPSSPPPILEITPPNVKQRKPTFSFLEKNKKDKDKTKAVKRKHDSSGTPSTSATNWQDNSTPLSEIQNSSARPPNTTPATGFMAVNSKYNVLPPPLNSEPQILSQQPSEPVPKPPLQKQSMVQSVLDFGQSFAPVTCSYCEMSYVASVAEDQQLHSMFHNRHNFGIELGKPFLKSAMKWCYEVSHISGSVVVVDRKISVPGRKIVQKVLEVVNKELGSVDINEEDLWSQRALDGDDGKKCDRYKVFLHVINGKCVGVCLAERISKAHRVLSGTVDNTPTKKSQIVTKPTTDAAAPSTQNLTPDSEKSVSTPAASSSISMSNETYPAVVGVSRIWTSRSYRRKGIANNLLECVLNQFIYGMEIDRSDVAFSQPTESGGLLARNWFGEKDGWAVYHEV